MFIQTYANQYNEALQRKKIEAWRNNYLTPRPYKPPVERPPHNILVKYDQITIEDFVAGPFNALR